MRFVLRKPSDGFNFFSVARRSAQSKPNQNTTMKTYICIENDGEYESDRGQFANQEAAEQHFGWEGIEDDFMVILEK